MINRMKVSELQFNFNPVIEALNNEGESKIIANKSLIDFLCFILKKRNNKELPLVISYKKNVNYITLTIICQNIKMSDNEVSELFSLSSKDFDFTQNLFEKNFNKKRIESQLNRMIKENVGFTYSGVFKTLVYWYEVKRGDVEKSHYSINIVPYVYNDAKEYYRQLWMVQQLNADKDIEAYKPKTKVITIPNPVRQELIKRKKFEFLKEEGE